MISGRIIPAFASSVACFVQVSKQLQPPYESPPSFVPRSPHGGGLLPDLHIGPMVLGGAADSGACGAGEMFSTREELDGRKRASRSRGETEGGPFWIPSSNSKEISRQNIFAYGKTVLRAIPAS